MQLSTLPLITFTILVLTCIISFQAFSNRALFFDLTFNPYQINNARQWFRFFSHALVHADFVHLAVNMLTLYMFGAGQMDRETHEWSGVEAVFFELFGHAKGLFLFALLYVGGVMLSSYPSFEKHKNNIHYNAVGASGAVAAVVFSSIIIYPTMKLSLFFLPIPMPAFIFGALYLVFSWYMARKGTDNIGHDAHFWGAVFGVVFTIAVKYQLFFTFIAQLKDYFGIR